MRVVPTLILAMVLLMTVPAVASATHGRSGTVIKKEQVTVYTTHYTSSHDRGRSHYRQPGHNSYRHSNRHVRQPPRYAPAYGYDKKHYRNRPAKGYHKKHYRPAPDRKYRHRSPHTRGYVSGQVPSIIVRIGF